MSDPFIPQPITLTEAIKAFLEYPDYARQAASTQRHKREHLSFLVEKAPYRGETLVGMLTEEHFLAAIQYAREPSQGDEIQHRKALGLPLRTGLSDKVLKYCRVTLRQFAELAVQRRWHHPHFNPVPKLATSMKANGNDEIKRERRWFPVSVWPEMLDAAEKRHPVNRMVIALGLFTGRRVSEYVRLKWGDLNILENEMQYENVKRGKLSKSFFDERFIAEYKKYRAWFEGMYGTIDPDWYLLPAKYLSYDKWPAIEYHALDEHERPYTKTLDRKGALGLIAAGETHLWPVKPTKPCLTKTMEDVVHNVCKDLGWPTEGADIHALRHSCAEFYNEKDPSGRTTQIVLGHDNLSTTLAAYSSLDHQAKLVKQAMKAGKFMTPKAPEASLAEGESQSVDTSSSRQGTTPGVVDLASWKAKRQQAG